MIHYFISSRLKTSKAAREKNISSQVLIARYTVLCLDTLPSSYMSQYEQADIKTYFYVEKSKRQRQIKRVCLKTPRSQQEKKMSLNVSLVLLPSCPIEKPFHDQRESSTLSRSCALSSIGQKMAGRIKTPLCCC